MDIFDDSPMDVDCTSTPVALPELSRSRSASDSSGQASPHSGSSFLSPESSATPTSLASLINFNLESDVHFQNVAQLLFPAEQTDLGPTSPEILDRVYMKRECLQCELDGFKCSLTNPARLQDAMDNSYLASEGLKRDGLYFIGRCCNRCFRRGDRLCVYTKTDSSKVSMKDAIFVGADLREEGPELIQRGKELLGERIRRRERANWVAPMFEVDQHTRMGRMRLLRGRIMNSEWKDPDEDDKYFALATKKSNVATSEAGDAVIEKRDIPDRSGKHEKVQEAVARVEGEKIASDGDGDGDGDGDEFFDCESIFREE